MMFKTGPIGLLAIVCCTLHSCAGVAVSAELGERFAIERMLAQTGASGGIVSYMGRPDADDLAKLSATYPFVHVLEGDARRADQLDKQLYELGLCGKVSVMRWRESYLPYADDLVNLVVMRDTGYEIRDTRCGKRDYAYSGATRCGGCAREGERGMAIRRELRNCGFWDSFSALYFGRREEGYIQG